LGFQHRFQVDRPARFRIDPASDNHKGAVMDESVETAVIELDQDKLLGFRELAAFAGDDATLAAALDDIHNKIGGEVPPI
jgi:hypothetical protein